MNWRAIPPVRRPVPTGRGTEQEGWAAIRRLSRHRAASLYCSGTQALQAAIQDCLAKHPRKSANVIVPAYGCPDLITACLGAAVVPRLVDVSAAGWGYDLTALVSAIDENTIAVIAVNLLGVGDAVTELLDVVREYNLALIQDSAQHLPAQHCDWPGHYIIFSFGKGKPLNLLGGGLAIGPANPLYQANPTPGHRALGSVAAGLLFNVITQPVAYALLHKLPGLKLGQTRYQLPSVLMYPRSALVRQLGPALDQYSDAPGYDAQIYGPYLDAWSKSGIQVVRECGRSTGAVLPNNPLRLALCAANANQCRRIVAELVRHKLGATGMYQVALNEVPGVPSEVRTQGPFPNADHLAKTLFTLPTHRAITARCAARINDYIVRASAT